MRQRPRAHLDRDPVDPSQNLVVMEDLLHAFRRVTDDERAPGSAESLEVGASNGWPPPFLPDLAEHPFVTGEVVVTRLLSRGGERSEGMDAYF